MCSSTRCGPGGGLDVAIGIAVRTGKRTAPGPKQQPLGDSLWNGGTVDGDKRTSVTRPVFVKGMRDHLFAGATLSGDVQGVAKLRRLLGQREHLLQRRPQHLSFLKDHAALLQRSDVEEHPEQRVSHPDHALHFARLHGGNRPAVRCRAIVAAKIGQHKAPAIKLNAGVPPRHALIGNHAVRTATDLYLAIVKRQHQRAGGPTVKQQRHPWSALPRDVLVRARGFCFPQSRGMVRHGTIIRERPVAQGLAQGCATWAVPLGVLQVG